MSFLNDWYRSGKNNREAFYGKYPFNQDDKALLSEFNRHREWLDGTKIRATPTVLFNGYELPDKYRVEDIKYFTKTEIV